ncbi:MAG: hypothetical protein ACJ73S_18915 [Mycobacteriales bacterium]
MPVTQPYAASYLYGGDQPTTLDDPSGQSPRKIPYAPEGPMGDTEAHDFAVTMSVEQLEQIYGVGNVYGDVQGYRYPITMKNGQRLPTVGRGRVYVHPTEGSDDKGYPDIVVNAGGTLYIFEVKPYTPAGFSKDALEQPFGYVNGLDRLGYDALLGKPDDIHRQTRYCPWIDMDVTIFSSFDWSNGEPAQLNMISAGIIYYTVRRPDPEDRYQPIPHPRPGGSADEGFGWGGAVVKGIGKVLGSVWDHLTAPPPRQDPLNPKIPDMPDIPGVPDLPVPVG